MDTNLLFLELMAQLQESWHGLGDKPDESPESILRELSNAVLPIQSGGALPSSVDEWVVNNLRELVARRIAGEPLSYLTGRQEFMGIAFLAGPGAMIPRKETEILGNAALVHLKALVGVQGFSTVIDLCTGSGNIALALAWHEPQCRVFGSDISAEAVELAERNAKYLGLTDRVRFRVGDFMEPFLVDEAMAPVDLVTCNPPYISSAKVEKMEHEIAGFEPRAAFDGGPFGISILNRLVKDAPRLLKPGGWVACETGLGQGDAMNRLFQKSPAYREVRTFQDAEGQVRVIVAQVLG